MPSETSNWQAAIDFLPIKVVIDHAVRQAYETGHTPYASYALVAMDSNTVLCVHYGDNFSSVRFMTRLQAEIFRKQFQNTFFTAFAA